MSKKHNAPAEPPVETTHPDTHPEEGHTSIIQPIVDELKGKYTPELPSDDEVAPPRGPLHPPQPADLDQDPGGGYNPDGTYPQV